MAQIEIKICSYICHPSFYLLLPLLLYLVPDLLEGVRGDYLGVHADLDDSIVLLVAETAVVTRRNHGLLVTSLTNIRNKDMLTCHMLTIFCGN